MDERIIQRMIHNILAECPVLFLAKVNVVDLERGVCSVFPATHYLDENGRKVKTSVVEDVLITQFVSKGIKIKIPIESGDLVIVGKMVNTCESLMSNQSDLIDDFDFGDYAIIQRISEGKTRDGVIEISNGGSKIEVFSGKIRLMGDLEVSGGLKVMGDVTSGVISLRGHKHPSNGATAIP